jgi:hypothetical protein
MKMKPNVQGDVWLASKIGYKFVAILTIEIIRMFFNFDGFPNKVRGVIRGEGKNFGLVKTNEVFGFGGVFGDS